MVLSEERMLPLVRGLSGLVNTVPTLTVTFVSLQNVSRVGAWYDIQTAAGDEARGVDR